MRTCEHGNCTFPVFGTDKNTGIGYCSGHQWCRTDKKPKKIAVRSKKQPSVDLSFGFDSQVDLFEYLWKKAKNSRERVICQFTGIDLTDIKRISFERWLCCFAHLLCKKNWTYFRLNPENVVIAAPDFHQIADCGSLADRAKHPDWKWDLWDRKVIETKQKYFEFKKQNLLR